ncbi:MAG TPA: helix-turn-helix domain-containing protein [Rhodanobacteraceae bacterium]|nr:helix-turn-helix domain-containing protein [Rhodanobacteraceae bacterium]
MSSSPRQATTGRRERKRQRMASYLAETAFELFEAQGYDAVTMEQIAAEADVAKATLYRYFPMKEALVAHHFKEDIVRGMSDLADELTAQKTFVSRMHMLLRQSAAWHESKRAYMPHYLRYINSQVGMGDIQPGPATASSVTWDILTRMFREAQRSGEVQKTVAAEKLAWSLEFLLYGAVTGWLLQPEPDLAEAFLFAFDLMMHGVGPKAGAA